ncbi:MAG: CPBP family intramembrane metalloprotease [Prevotellaceae bacterium]|jgi:membrane protease YdiL (CAAX protease family)|nr:CPBP family intramembrane metalloprotease [Prevotellaceae bacterium]
MSALVGNLILFISGLALTVTSGADVLPVSTIRWIQVEQNVLLFALPSLLCAWAVSRKPFDLLRLNSLPPVGAWLCMGLFVMVALPAVNLLSMLNNMVSLPDFLSPMEEWMRAKEIASAEITVRLLEMDNLATLGITLVVMAALPALGEELVFRGLLQRLIEQRIGLHAGVWIAAVLFSAIHLQFFGFVPRMLLGAAFGYMAAWTGSLWLPIAAHFLHNAFAVITAYLQQRHIISVDVDAIGAGSEWWLGVASAAIALWAVSLIKRYKIREKTG